MERMQKQNKTRFPCAPQTEPEGCPPRRCHPQPKPGDMFVPGLRALWWPCGDRPPAPSSLLSRCRHCPSRHFCISVLTSLPCTSPATAFPPHTLQENRSQALCARSTQLCAPVTCLPFPKTPKAQTDSCLVSFVCTSGVL